MCTYTRSGLKVIKTMIGWWASVGWVGWPHNGQCDVIPNIEPNMHFGLHRRLNIGYHVTLAVMWPANPANTRPPTNHRFYNLESGSSVAAQWRVLLECGNMGDAGDNPSSFEEQLINAVFVREFIYDKMHPDHSNRAKVKHTWSHIAEEVGKPGNERNDEIQSNLHDGKI